MTTTGLSAVTGAGIVSLSPFTAAVTGVPSIVTASIAYGMKSSRMSAALRTGRIARVAVPEKILSLRDQVSCRP